MPDISAGHFAVAKRLIGWAIAILVLYSGTMAFVMLFSLASAYEKIQNVPENGSISDTFDSNYLNRLQTDARRARSAADDPTVGVLELLPWIGRDIHAARVLSYGLGENLQALMPLFEQRDAISVKSNDLPKTLNALSNSIDSLDVAITRFDGQLETVSPKDLHFGIGNKVQKLKDIIQAVRLAVHEANPLLKASAIMLNQPGKTQWFIATQNAAELRASGGLLGSYAVLNIEDGKISLTDFGADSKLLGKGALQVQFKNVENVWGADLADWRDLNVSSHIPDDGEIIAQAWKQKFHSKLDGVVFFSQGTVAHLVGAVGNLKLKGIELTSANTVEFLSKNIYAKYPNVTQKNNAVSKLMSTLFVKISNHKIDAEGLFKSLADRRNVDDVYLWSPNETIQGQIEDKGISGSISRNSGSDVVVGLNNGGGNKLDAYLKTKYEYRLGKCGLKTWDDLAGRSATVKITLTNNAPKSGLPKYVNPRLDLRPGQKWIQGSNREVVSIYAPKGSSDEQFYIDGVEEGASFTTSNGRPLYVMSVELMPGQTRVIEVKFIQPIVNPEGENIQESPTLKGQRTLGGSTDSSQMKYICGVG